MTRGDKSRIILGVTGSIAAYKACSLIRQLSPKNYEIAVVMTEAAQKLVTSHTFRSLSGRPVVTDLWTPAGNNSMAHIALSEWTNLLAIVPATANIIGKFTAGIADDIVSTTWLACDCPKIIAPAMNDKMWHNESVQRNIETLKTYTDITIVGPVAGRLATGKKAETGHLAPVDKIVKTITRIASEK